MAQFESKADFQVKWMPFQLNPNASSTGTNKMQMYMQKFGRTREATMQMSQWMASNFAKVGLPYKFTDEGLVGNTFNAHRLTSYAFAQGGPAMQDNIVEELFRNYFGEEKFMNDPAVLEAAAVRAGLSAEDAKRVTQDESFFADETRRELAYGRRLGVTGVPFFIIQGERGQTTVSGAQDPEVLAKSIAQIL